MKRPIQGLPAVFSVLEAAELLGVSTKTVRRLLANKELSHHRVGRLIRITEPDLIDLLRRKRTM
jgi:excisionase family DNA binding protein